MTCVHQMGNMKLSIMARVCLGISRFVGKKFLGDIGCGLWVLLHSLSARIEDGESHFAFRAICEFVPDFFICEECRQHFYHMCSSVGSPFKTSRDFALWLWEAHNKLNGRLMKEEASLGTGDPMFPKIIWPPKQLCSSCYLSQSRRDNRLNKIQWYKDEVYRFLTNYYGKKLASLYIEKGHLGNEVTNEAIDELVASTSAVVVPVGAALAIALASRAFGALACYWRSQQKSRKPRRRKSELKYLGGPNHTLIKVPSWVEIKV